LGGGKAFQSAFKIEATKHFMMEPGMKIKVESEKIIKAVKKLDGIEIVLENAEDGKEALNLILRKTGLFDREDYGKLKDVTVTSLQKYETSAVDYKMIFLLEFIFEKDVSLDTKVGILKEFQEFFNKI
jgi:copper chaperone CopZ